MEAYLSIAARPETVSFDPSRTAIMVIDMQNDFGSRVGMFDRAGLDVAPIARLIQPISRVLEAARAAGLFIVYTRQEHNADLSDAGNEDAPHRIKHKRMNVGRTVEARTVPKAKSWCATLGIPQLFQNLRHNSPRRDLPRLPLHRAQRLHNRT